MDSHRQRQSAVVRRTSARARYTFKDTHDVLFPAASPDVRSILDYDDGIRDLMRRKHPPLGTNNPVNPVC